MNDRPKIIISGGGTGGHIFPALSIADAIRSIYPDAQILFVGAKGRMEMEKVPAAGYPIKALPVAGLQRKLSLSNLALPFKVLKSVTMASNIIREFKPDAVVGVGGYASAPVLWSASHKGIPCLIQEQNSYAGLTNRLLGKKVKKVCVAYEGMERFFPADKIILTGNPVRGEIDRPTAQQKEKGYRFYNLDPTKKTLFIVGGSLGCGTLNRSVKKWINEMKGEPSYQVIWQSGKYYSPDIEAFLKGKDIPYLHNFEFIKRMDLAFAAADVVVSRAGAGTISELCIEGKATVFVPSPNVSEDHQTHNAMALVNKAAALIVRDAEAEEKLFNVAEELIGDEKAIAVLEENILKLGRKDAADRIAREVLSLI